MFGLTYIADSLAGAWALMRGRAEGLARLDLTLEGFWRSFAAIALAAPFSLIALMSQQKLAAEAGEAAGADPRLAADVFTIAVDWILFPIIFALVAPPLGLAGRYVPFIVARNWAAVIFVAGVSIIHSLHLVGILPAELATILLFVALAVTLRFAYLVARTALGVGVSLALPIVVLDFLVSLVIWSLASRAF